MIACVSVTAFHNSIIRQCGILFAEINIILFPFIFLIDLIPPNVTLKSFPNLVSNATEWTFTFECADEQGCSFSCSAHEKGQLAQYSPCETSYLVESLTNGQEYEFEVVATDGVGNIGQPVVHLWKIGECTLIILTEY